MSFTGGQSDYDRGVNTFSPEGRLFQVEYALEAIKLGSTAVGLISKDSVVLVVEKRVPSPLAVPASIEKVWEIDSHCGCAMSGLTADARALVEHARGEAINHWFTFNEKMRTESIVQAVGDVALDFSRVRDSKRRSRMARPFGVSLMVAGADFKVRDLSAPSVDGGESEPKLFLVDPSGTVVEQRAAAIGAAQEGATAMLNEKWKEGLNHDQALRLALTVLREVTEEKITKNNCDVAMVRAGAWSTMKTEQLGEILDALPSESTM